MITGFDRNMSTEFPSFFPGKIPRSFGLVFRHAFGDSLENGESAKEQSPDQPARDSDVTNDQTRHREIAAFQFRVRLDPRQRQMAANNSGDRRDEKKSATKSAHAEDAEDQ